MTPDDFSDFTPSDAKVALWQRTVHNLTLHKPNDDGARKMDALREAAIEFAAAIITLCPEGRELAQSITELELALQHGIAAIARYVPPSPISALEIP